jgi:transcriptional regulator with XRE-family HTH domain
MALFFDQEWFDARLAAMGSTREDLGRLLHLTADEVGELWKDQRELRATDVLLISRFLNVGPSEVALRAGVSTPVPRDQESVAARLDLLERRLEQVERLLAQHQAKE